MKKDLLVIFLVLIATASFPQFKKGNRLYNQGEYFKALAPLKKASTTKSTNQADALFKLADSYLHLKEYQQAELYFKKSIDAGNNTPEVHLGYANVLKNNNHYPEALDQFKIYLDAKPGDETAKNATKACKEMKTWQNLPKEYAATNLDAVNTAKSEFSPVLMNNKLIYVTEKKPDLVNYDQYDFTGEPYLNIYFTKLKDGIPTSGKESFSKKLNRGCHDGPICFSKDQNTIFFTRTIYLAKKNKTFVNRTKLFYSVKKGNGWSTPQPFSNNSNDYSTAHPALSENGNTLIFSSDMPGGKGGMDLWQCTKDKETWSKPINLGPDVNTPENEEFPYLRNDGMLFFSSDGLATFGGLDIFTAKQIAGKWILNRNEGLGINSFADDFGICFTDPTKGYLSSNRDGGKGCDDIYSFTFTTKLISIDGTILNSQDLFDAAKNLRVYLEDEKENRLNDTHTNDLGYFRFDNLDPEKKYLVKIDENDPGFNGKKYYFYADAHNQVMRVTMENEKGEKYCFRNLPADPNALPQISIPDDVNFGGNILFGENPSSPVANKQVILKDEKGNVLETVTTNAFGAFVFTKIPPDENYFIEINETDASIPLDSKVILTNKSGKSIKIIRSNGKGGFSFSILSSDKNTINQLIVTDNELLMDLNGVLLGQDNNKLTNTIVYLTDENGNKIDTTVTDNSGKFEFRKIKAGGNYLVAIDESDAKIIGMDKLFIADLKGRVLREILRNKNKGFSFSLLSAEKNSMKQMYVDDPWLEVLELKEKKSKEEITIVENVYYGLNEYRFDDQGRRVMDKVIQIMNSNKDLMVEISSHTDSRADDKFNKTLSEKRAKFAVDYIISNHIDPARLKAVGYGESKLINKCGNNIPCSEEEHAQNRRTEFRITDKNKTK